MQTHTCVRSSTLKDAAPHDLSRSPRRRLWPQYPACWRTSCDHRNSPREPAPQAGLHWTSLWPLEAATGPPAPTTPSRGPVCLLLPPLWPLELKQTLGAWGWHFMLGEAETGTCLGSGSGAAPQPQHPPPRPGPALRGLLTSHEKSWWGRCSRRRDPHLVSCPGTPNLQGEPAAVCMHRSSIESLGSLLTVKGLEVSGGWVTAPGPLRLALLQNSSGLNDITTHGPGRFGADLAGLSSMIQVPGLGTGKRLLSWHEASVTEEFQG